MARIVSVAIAVPPTNASQLDAVEFARHHFSSKFPDIDRLLAVYKSSMVEYRQFCVPKEWFLMSHDVEEKNDTYIKWACRLGAEAARKCLEKAGAFPEEIDHIIFISTTGLATPSIDARLANILKLRSDISRTPVWGLGCAGGAMGLAMAHDYVKAYPQSKVLLVAVELCGLTFQFDDLSKSNLVATALFGDGAAAVLLDGGQGGPEIIDTRSTLWPDSLDVMGWNILNSGMQVVLIKALPSFVGANAREDIEDFIFKHELRLDDITHFLIHPGGAKVLEAYRKALCLEQEALALSAEVLREHGNISSVTILYILERFIRSENRVRGSWGLMNAVGPGFSSQNLLIKV